MKQLIGRSDTVVITRMPAPRPGPRDVLVRNRFSLVSTGTEIAGMTPGGGGGHRTRSLYRLEEQGAGDVSTWEAFGEGRTMQPTSPGGPPTFATGTGEYGYVARSPVLTLAPDSRHVISIRVRVLSGNVSAGLLNEGAGEWLTTQSYPYPRPELRFTLHYDLPAGKPLDVVALISNHRPGDGGSSSFELLEVTHQRWARYDAPAEPEPEPEEPLTPEQRVKKAVKRMVVRLTGEENSWQEQTLKRWYGRLTGDPVMANAPIVRGRDLPSDEMQHQGWFIGYSCAGEVVEVGSEVTEFAPGDLVACAGAGRANHAELVSVPVMLTARLPDGVDPRMGCSATVGSIAMQGVRRAEVELGHRVVVIGLGLIGQLTVQMLKAAGCRVIGFDLQEDRVERARQRGMDDGATDDAAMVSIVNRLTGEHGADSVIITAATKSAAPVNLAMKLARRRGKVVISGDIDIHPARADFYKKEIDLGMATSYGPGRYDNEYELEGRDYPYGYVRWTANRNLESYLELLSTGAVDFLGLIEAEVAAEDAAEAYAELVNAPVKPLAVVLRFDDDGQEADASPSADLAMLRPRVDLDGGNPVRPASTDGPCNFVLVGAGGFAQGMLAPRLLECPELFQFYGLVSSHGAGGSNFARQLGVTRVATDPSGFLDDEEAQAFVIATRHHLHAEQALGALKAGKHVFLEKPLATTTAQFQTFLEGYAALDRKPVFMVGFNRRFSPAILRLQEELAGRSAPMMVNYRLNGGRIPTSSWIQGAEGGGRNVGEACHMYDVFRSLTGAPAVDVRALPIASRPADTLANDNFVATIRYEDGSVCTLTYTAIGPRQGMPKERVEVFCDGRGWIVDDYVRLTAAGTDAPLWEGAVDKGHAEEIRRFGESIRHGGASPIAAEEIIETTAVSLAIEEMLRSG